MQTIRPRLCSAGHLCPNQSYSDIGRVGFAFSDTRSQQVFTFGKPQLSASNNASFVEHCGFFCGLSPQSVPSREVRHTIGKYILPDSDKKLLHTPGVQQANFHCQLAMGLRKAQANGSAEAPEALDAVRFFCVCGRHEPRPSKRTHRAACKWKKYMCYDILYTYTYLCVCLVEEVTHMHIHIVWGEKLTQSVCVCINT